MATLSSRLTPLTVSVPAMSEWTSYTPTISNLGPSGSVTTTARWRRVGDSIQINADFTQTANFSSSTGTITIDLLSALGLNADVAKIVSSSGSTFGNLSGEVFAVGYSAGETHTGRVEMNSSSTTTVRFAGDDGSGVWSTSGSVPAAWAVSTLNAIRMSVFIPISGWTSHTASATSANAVVVGGQSVGSTMNFGATSNQGFNILANNAAAIASTAAGALTLGNTSVPANFAGTNIVGRVGTAATAGVAAGYVGEQKTASTSAYTGTGTTTTTISSISLEAGVWEVTGYVSVQQSSGTITLAEMSAALTTNSSLTVNAFDCVNNPTTMCGGYLLASSNTLRYASSITNRFQHSATTIVYLRLGFAVTGGGSGSVNGYMRATRIA